MNKELFISSFYEKVAEIVTGLQDAASTVPSMGGAQPAPSLAQLAAHAVSPAKKKPLEKCASGSPAPTHSLAHRDARRHRQGHQVGRAPTAERLKRERQRGQAAMGNIAKGATIAGPKQGPWNPTNVSRARGIVKLV